MPLSHAEDKRSLLKEKPPFFLIQKWGEHCRQKKKKRIHFAVWKQNVLNGNKITHYALVVNMRSLPIVKHCPLSKKLHIHDYGMANSNKLGGGHQMLLRTIEYCERCPDFLSVPPDQTPTPPSPTASAPCLEFKQLFCFVKMASACLFSFLSFYFLPFFFRGISSCSG